MAEVGYVGPLRKKDGRSISYDEMMERAVKLGAIGSLGYAFELLKAQKEGKEIFPVESRGKHYFPMPRTEMVGGNYRHVAYFYRNDKVQLWVLDFSWDDRKFRRAARFIIPRGKLPLAT